MSEEQQVPDVQQVEKNVLEAKSDAEADDNLIRLSTGVVLEAGQANPNVLLKVMSRVPRPQPPKYYNKNMGREMENPDDPDYINRVQMWQAELAYSMTVAMIVFGTSLKSVPKGMPRPEDDSWLGKLRLLGLDVVEDDPNWRYLNWVMSVAAPLDVDTKAINDKVGKLSGVSEASVQNAANFPGRN